MENQKFLFGVLFYLLEDVLKECIDSLNNEILNSNIKNYEILIIANSPLKNQNFLNKKIKIIQNSKNNKFAKSSNQIFKYGLENNFDNIFLINKDTIFKKDSLKNLVLVSKKIQKPYIVSPIQLNENNEIDKKSIDLYKNLKENIQIDKMLNDKQNNFFEIKFMNAACWMIHIDVIKKLGGFNEIFYHYGNDNDYIKRLRKLKLFHGIIPSSKITHTRVFAHTGHISKMRRDSEISSKVYSYLLHTNNVWEGTFKSIRYFIKMTLYGKVSLINFLTILKNYFIIYFQREKLKFDL